MRNPKRIFLTATLFLFAGVLPLSAVHAESPDTLVVMTFNIRFGTANDGEDRWELRKQQVFDLLSRYSPDIIGVQEALRFQLDEIRNAHPQYSEVGAGRDDGKSAGEYSAILFRSDRFTPTEERTFWFSDTPDSPGSTTWGNSIPRICSWVRLLENNSGKAFYVYNVHLDHISQPSREKSVVSLARAIQSRQHADPVIVTGDFNAGETNPAIRFLKGDDSTHIAGANDEHIELIDTFRSIHADEKMVGTFHAFNGDTSGEKIDFVFVERNTKVIDASILHDNVGGRYPSDHFPVTARILFP